MRTSDADILIVPGLAGLDDDHWQARWLRTLKTTRLVEQDNWTEPEAEAWAGRIIDSAVQSARPVVIAAHSLGVAAVAHLAQRMPKGFITGAFLVAPADVDKAADWPVTDGATFDAVKSGFAPLPVGPLPFPSVLIASSTDPYCSLERAGELAKGWGSELVEAGDAGHINTAAGYGPWPDGALRFGAFLRTLES